MADTAETIRAELEKQIAELKNDIGTVTKRLASRASGAMDDAEDMYEDGRARAAGMARQVRHQAHAVTDAARENPGTAATVATSIGLLGFVAGLVIGAMISTSPRGR